MTQHTYQIGDYVSVLDERDGADQRSNGTITEITPHDTDVSCVIELDNGHGIEVMATDLLPANPAITAQHVLDLAHSPAADAALVHHPHTGELEVRSTMNLDGSTRIIATRDDLHHIEQSDTIDINNMSTDDAQAFADHLNQDDNWTDTDED